MCENVAEKDNEKISIFPDDHDDVPWTGVWFPKNPEIRSKEQIETVDEDEDTLQMAESRINGN